MVMLLCYTLAFSEEIYADFYAKILDWNFRLVDENSQILVVVFVSKLNFCFSFSFVDENCRIFVVVVFVTKINLFSSTKIFVFVVVDEKSTDLNHEADAILLLHHVFISFTCVPVCNVCVWRRQPTIAKPRTNWSCCWASTSLTSSVSCDNIDRWVCSQQYYQCTVTSCGYGCRSWHAVQIFAGTQMNHNCSAWACCTTDCLKHPSWSVFYIFCSFHLYTWIGMDDGLSPLLVVHVMLWCLMSVISHLLQVPFDILFSVCMLVMILFQILIHLVLGGTEMVQVTLLRRTLASSA